MRKAGRGLAVRCSILQFDFSLPIILGRVEGNSTLVRRLERGIVRQLLACWVQRCSFARPWARTRVMCFVALLRVGPRQP